MPSKEGDAFKIWLLKNVLTFSELLLRIRAEISPMEMVLGENPSMDVRLMMKILILPMVEQELFPWPTLDPTLMEVNVRSG